MIDLYTVHLKYSYGEPLKFNVAAKTSDKAIERARIQAWKDYKYRKKTDWDVIYLAKMDTQVVI